MLYLDDLDDIVYYLYLDEKYIDFKTIMYLINKEKTFTWRILIKLEIPFINYQNRQLYKFDDIIKDTILMDLLDLEKLGLI